MAQNMVRRAMRLEAVLEALGLSRSAFYAGIKEGFYPAPTKIGERTAVWWADEIAKVQTLAIEQRNAGLAAKRAERAAAEHAAA